MIRVTLHRVILVATPLLVTACDGDRRKPEPEAVGTVESSLAAGSNLLLQADPARFWAETAVATIPPKPNVDTYGVVFVPAMQYNFTSCGGTATYNGVGTVTYSARSGVANKRAPGSAFAFPVGATCNKEAGDPRAAGDETRGNLFMTQSCTTNAGTPPVGPNGADGLIVNASTDRGATFGNACEICGFDTGSPPARWCSAAGYGGMRAPDLYYDDLSDSLFAAWQDAGDFAFGSPARYSFIAASSAALSCNWSVPQKTTPNSDTTTPQQYPSLATISVSGTTRLVVAYWRPTGMGNFGVVEVAYANAPFNSQTSWSLATVETVSFTAYVDTTSSGLVRQQPRPRLVRQSAGMSSTLFLVYPAYNSATSTNELRYATSIDGSSWSTPEPVPGGTPGADRFFPALSTRRGTTEVMLTYYEQVDTNGNVKVKATQWDFGASAWLTPVTISRGGRGSEVAFLPCTLALPNNDKFYGEYTGMAGLSDPGGTRHYPAWADSRNGKSDIWATALTP